MEIILIIIVVIILIALVPKSKSKTDESESVRKYIELQTKKPVSKLENINDGYFSIPKKIFSEKPIENIYRFEDIFHSYKDDVRYRVSTYPVKIKGLYHRHLKEIERARELTYGEQVYLEKEKDNKFDYSAIKVLTWDGYWIGYIDKQISFKIRELIEECFLVKCFIYQAGYGEIPYQTVIIYAVKDKLQDIKIRYNEIEHQNQDFENLDKTANKEDIYLIDYKYKISRLQENIKRSQKSADKMFSQGKMNLYQNALDRIKMYEDELERINELKKDIDKNRII